jgi:NADPH:quinone reductase-like Zn-dependent oxidoreductase
MAYPNTYSAFRRTVGSLPNTIEQSQESLPTELGPHDVMIKIHAVSLNYRDVAMLIGTYPVPCTDKEIPCSDCAAEVVAMGPNVSAFKKGDAVSPITGIGKYEDTDDGFQDNLGTNVEGVLREYAVFHEKHLVHLPAHMSWEEVNYPTALCALRRHITKPS